MRVSCMLVFCLSVSLMYSVRVAFLCVLYVLYDYNLCDFTDVHTISTTLRSEKPVCTSIVSLVRMTGSVANSSGSSSSFDSRRLVVGFDDTPAAVILLTVSYALVVCVFLCFYVLMFCVFYIVGYVDFSYRSSLYGLCFMLLLCFMWLPYMV